MYAFAEYMQKVSVGWMISTFLIKDSFLEVEGH